MGNSQKTKQRSNYSNESITSARKIKKNTNLKDDYNKINMIRDYVSDDNLEITGVRRDILEINLKKD